MGYPNDGLDTDVSSVPGSRKGSLNVIKSLGESVQFRSSIINELMEGVVVLSLVFVSMYRAVWDDVAGDSVFEIV